jgi:DNA-binding transcriptional regulator GbsR (MarR family)
MSKRAAERPGRNDPFIEALARLIIPMGMPPIAARMQGYIMLSPEPLTLDELVEGLGVSKSSASVAARLLERYGVVQCHTERGTKRVRYGVAERCAGFLREQARFIGAMAELLQSTAQANPDAGAAARLTDMGAFYGRVHDALDAVLTGP